jgi:hypothetical protein
MAAFFILLILAVISGIFVSDSCKKYGVPRPCPSVFEGQGGGVDFVLGNQNPHPLAENARGWGTLCVLVGRGRPSLQDLSWYKTKAAGLALAASSKYL